MKTDRQKHGGCETQRDHRALATAGLLSWTGSTPSSHSPANTTSTSSSTSATTSEGQLPLLD